MVTAAVVFKISLHWHSFLVLLSGWFSLQRVLYFSAKNVYLLKHSKIFNQMNVTNQQFLKPFKHPNLINKIILAVLCAPKCR